MILVSRHAITRYLDRELETHKWVKRLTERQLWQELRQLRTVPQFKTDPWLHQLACFYLGLHYLRFLFILDMGLGKSKLVIDLIEHRFRQKRLSMRRDGRTALVIVPGVLNTVGWGEDIERHSLMEPHLITCENIEQKRYELLHPQGEVTVIDMPSLALALSTKKKGKGRGKLLADKQAIARAQQLYGFIGVDETHKYKNHETLWYDVLDPLCEAADEVKGLTGTIFSASPIEMWPQFNLVDRGETFENRGLFQAAFFDSQSDHVKGTVYTFRPERTRTLNRMMQHRSIQYDESEVHELPERVYRPIRMELAGEADEHYRRALEGVINVGAAESSKLDGGWVRMRQICGGYLKWSDAHGAHKLVFAQNPKLDMLIRLLEDIGSKKAVVCHDYTDSAELIEARLKKEGIKYATCSGRTKDKPAERARFLDDPTCRVFLMQNAAGGTGTDGLQKVSNYMIFFESPASPGLRKQVEKRIHRPGQTQRAFYYDLTYGRTVDSGIREAHKQGFDLYEAVMSGRSSTLRGLMS